MLSSAVDVRNLPPSASVFLETSVIISLHSIKSIVRPDSVLGTVVVKPLEEHVSLNSSTSVSLSGLCGKIGAGVPISFSGCCLSYFAPSGLFELPSPPRLLLWKRPSSLFLTSPGRAVKKKHIHFGF